MEKKVLKKLKKVLKEEMEKAKKEKNEGFADEFTDGVYTGYISAFGKILKIVEKLENGQEDEYYIVEWDKEKRTFEFLNDALEFIKYMREKKGMREKEFGIIIKKKGE